MKENSSFEKQQNDRIRNNTSPAVNLKIDHYLEEEIRKYANQDIESITKKITQLNKEWDIERWLELNASIISFIGVLLGFLSLYWLILPLIILAFLSQHAIQGWCPPIPIFRKLGVRTQKEIDQEIYALKLLRGDFGSNIIQQDIESRIQYTLIAIRK